MICPSFRAASTNAGVIGSGGGAEAMTRVENAAPASNAPEPLSRRRRDKFGCFIGSLIPGSGETWYTGSYLLFLAGAASLSSTAHRHCR